MRSQTIGLCPERNLFWGRAPARGPRALSMVMSFPLALGFPFKMTTVCALHSAPYKYMRVVTGDHARLVLVGVLDPQTCAFFSLAHDARWYPRRLRCVSCWAAERCSQAVGGRAAMPQGMGKQSGASRMFFGRATHSSQPLEKTKK